MMRISATELGLIELGRASATDIHLLVDFAGDLDAGALQVAWSAVADRHPILSMRVEGDRWVPGGGRPAFEVVGPLRPDEIPALHGRATLRVGSVDGGVRVALSVDHVAVDGRGLLFLFEDLRLAYATIIAGDTPDRRVDTTTRSLAEAVHAAIPARERLRLVAEGTSRWAGLPPSTHVDPGGDIPTTPRHRYAAVPFGEVFAGVQRIRDETTFSTDGIVLGLLTAAWADVFGQRPGGGSGWVLATDLRSRLGIDGGIGNLSGSELVAIPGDVTTAAARAIPVAAATVDETREGWPGAGPEALAGMYPWVPPAIAAQAARRTFDAAAARGYTRVVTNIGAGPPDLHRWPGVEAHRVAFVPPLASPPYVSLLLLTTGAGTALSARVGDDWFTSRHLQSLVEHMRRGAAEYSPPRAAR
jgi:hypothetical protein